MVRFCVFSLFCCPKVSAEVLIVVNALCLHLSGPGGEGGGAAACRGADSALGSGCYRHPAGWEDEPVRQPAGLPGQPVHRHHLPAWRHQPGVSLRLCAEYLLIKPRVKWTQRRWSVHICHCITNKQFLCRHPECDASDLHPDVVPLSRLDLAGRRAAAPGASPSGSGAAAGGSSSSGTNPESSVSSARPDSGCSPPSVHPDPARHGASAPRSSSSTDAHTGRLGASTAAVLPASRFQHYITRYVTVHHFDMMLVMNLSLCEACLSSGCTQVLLTLRADCSSSCSSCKPRQHLQVTHERQLVIEILSSLIKPVYLEFVFLKMLKPDEICWVFDSKVDDNLIKRSQTPSPSHDRPADEALSAAVLSTFHRFGFPSHHRGLNHTKPWNINKIVRL